MLRLLQQDTRHPACADKWAGHVRSLMSSFWDLIGEPLNYHLDPTCAPSFPFTRPCACVFVWCVHAWP